MMAFDDAICRSRRSPQAAITDGDGVILTRLAGGGRAMASAMKLAARSSRAFPEVAVDVSCWLQDAWNIFRFLLSSTISRNVCSLAIAMASVVSVRSSSVQGGAPLTSSDSSHLTSVSQ